MVASQNTTDAALPSAHVVGNMFVENYYLILHQHPEEVQKFYKDCSALSRPDINGVMQSVTTIQAIDEKIMSLDSKSYMVEIKTVDAQHSFKHGVIVLVTGLLTGKDKRVQKFTQSFFLAPMESEIPGYFVLNDVFRFVADDPPEDMDYVVVGGPDATGTSIPTTSLDSTAIPVHDISNGATVLPEESKGCMEAQEPLENGCTEVHDVQEPAPSTNTNSQSQEATPKKSYASIVKVTRMATASPSMSSPAVKVQTTTVNMDKQPVKQSVAPTPVAKVQSDSVNAEKQTAKKPFASAPILHPETSSADTNGAAENGSPSEAAEGFSIYIRNLPLNATPSQVEGEFKKFGAIKPGGVQVRNHKQHGYCFGFVEFEALTSMESALEALVTIVGRRIVIEEKKTTTRVGPGGIVINSTGGGRGRFPLPRGGFRNDGFRGYGMRNNGFRERGGYAGGQGYGRSDFRARGEFFYRGRGGSRAAEGYQQVGRPNMNRTAVTAA